MKKDKLNDALDTLITSLKHYGWMNNEVKDDPKLRIEIYDDGSGEIIGTDIYRSFNTIMELSEILTES